MARLALAVALVLPALAHGQESEPYRVQDHYDKAEYRIPMRDGVELFTAVYTPEGRLGGAPVPDPAEPDLLRRRPLRRGQVPGPAGPLDGDDEGGVHRRPPGRPRPVHVRRRVRQHAAPRPRRRRDRRELRHLRHHRVAPGARRGPQRQGRHLGDLLPRLLRRRIPARGPPGAGRRLAPGADLRLLLRRLPPPRRLHARLLPDHQRLQLPEGRPDHRALVPDQVPRVARRLQVLPRPRAAQERRRVLRR